MRIVIHDAQFKTLGYEHIDGTWWLVRDNKFFCMDDINILIRYAGTPAAFVLMNNAGKILSKGKFHGAQRELEAGTNFVFKSQALYWTMLGDNAHAQ